MSSQHTPPVDVDNPDAFIHWTRKRSWPSNSIPHLPPHVEHALKACESIPDSEIEALRERRLQLWLSCRVELQKEWEHVRSLLEPHVMSVLFWCKPLASGIRVDWLADGP